MDIKELIEKLEIELEVEKGNILPTTNIRDVDWWSSMHALIIIALVDTDYDVQITGSDLKKIESIQNLYDFIVKNKK